MARKGRKQISEPELVAQMVELFDGAPAPIQRKMLAGMTDGLPDGFAIIFTADAAWIEVLPTPKTPPPSEPSRPGFRSGIAAGLALSLLGWSVRRRGKRGA